MSRFDRDGEEIRQDDSAELVMPEISESGAQNDSFSSEGDVEYDMRSSSLSHDSGEWGVSSMGGRQRRSTGDEPVKYPEGSLGAFSTPEDYEAHTVDQSDVREPEPEPYEPEYDDPILLFPPDEVDDDLYRTVNSGKKHHRRIFSDESDIDDSVGISFSRYKAENKEGEFFFMPFLDIPDEPEDSDDDEDEGEEVSFSFRKVDADQVKKEKEFIFMPFLNVSDNTDDDNDDDDDHHRRRNLKGTIFDEGLYLIPLEAEEEEEPEKEEEKEEDEEDSGIYVVGSEGGFIPKAPKVPRPPEKKTALKDVDTRSADNKKKKRPAGSQKKKPPAKKGAQGSGGKLSPTEEQFRAAMRNVSPEIRAAVKNDPIQRAALEQAVRIALVQQAAQEAVEKATGRPVFGGSSISSGKKRRPPRPPQKASNSMLGGGSRARNVSFSPFTLRTSYQDDGGVSEFGVTEDKTASSASEFGSAASAAPAAPAAASAAAAEAAPDSNQDPVLAMLNGENKEQTADASQQAARRAAYQSPAAVRAAMRTGLEVDTPGASQAVTATGPKTTMTAAERELQVKRSGCLIWLIVAFAVFFIGLIGILVLPNITKQNNFDKALDMMDRGQYMQAIQMFEKFTPDDTKFYDDCRVNISECAYRQASQYFSDGKYYEAYNLLVSKAVINNDTKPLALRSNYYYAEQLYAEGDWQNAANAYAYLLSDKYEDSQEKYNICQYQLAQEKADKGDYLQAYQSFAALGSYSDSPIRAAEMVYEAWNADSGSVTMVQLTDAVQVLAQQGSAETLDILSRIYNKAGEYAAAREYKMAYQSYRALGTYSQSAYNAALCMYNIWSDDLTFGTLTQREDAMIALRQRMGDDQAAEVLESSGFNPVRLMGEWSDGDSTITISRVNAASEELKIVLDLASHDGSRVQVESSAVGFDGNVVYYLTDPENVESKQPVIEVTRFDSLVALEPGSFTAFCFLNNSEYELTRQ